MVLSLFGMVEVLIFIICGYFLQVASILNVMSVGLRAYVEVETS